MHGRQVIVMSPYKVPVNFLNAQQTEAATAFFNAFVSGTDDEEDCPNAGLW